MTIQFVRAIESIARLAQFARSHFNTSEFRPIVRNIVLRAYQLEQCPASGGGIVEGGRVLVIIECRARAPNSPQRPGRLRDRPLPTESIRETNSRSSFGGTKDFSVRCWCCRTAPLHFLSLAKSRRLAGSRVKSSVR